MGESKCQRELWQEIHNIKQLKWFLKGGIVRYFLSENGILGDIAWQSENCKWPNKSIAKHKNFKIGWVFKFDICLRHQDEDNPGKQVSISQMLIPTSILVLKFILGVVQFIYFSYITFLTHIVGLSATTKYEGGKKERSYLLSRSAGKLTKIGNSRTYWTTWYSGMFSFFFGVL